MSEPEVSREDAGARLVIVAATALLLLSAGSNVLGISGPLAPFVAQVGSGRALLALRGGLLAAATWPLVHAPDTRAMKVFGGIACLFVASVAAEGLLLPFVLATLTVVLRYPLPPPPWPPRVRKAALAIALACVPCFALALGYASSRGAATSAPPHLDPATEAGHWLAEGNVFRARYWARIAAQQAGGESVAPSAP